MEPIFEKLQFSRHRHPYGHLLGRCLALCRAVVVCFARNLIEHRRDISKSEVDAGQLREKFFCILIVLQLFI